MYLIRNVILEICQIIHKSEGFSITSPSLFSSIFSSSSSSEKSLERSKRWASPASSPPSGLAKLIALDVICGKDHMTVRAEFNGPFNGIVASKGTYGQDNCVYVKPYSGVTHTTFKVNYDSCGTKPDLQGKYYENTIVVQYGTDIIEAWDEAKRLRCEWFEAYEKPATFRPAIPVADLDVIEMNFQGDDIDCWMEIQEGKGPWAREVNRIVPVGQPMTIVVSINDFNGQFDMRVKSCFAHDGVKPPIQLTDEHGCVLRPKMLSPFNKIKDPNGKATVISYSHFYAFKFPDTMNVQIQCTVEVCRHGCPDACQKGPYPTPIREIHPKVQLGTSNPTASASNQHQVSRVKDETEAKPVYQDVTPNRQHQQNAQLPGISDQAVINHATQFLSDQGIDLSSFKNGQPAFIHDSVNPFGEESRDAPHFISSVNTSSSGHQEPSSTSAPVNQHQTSNSDDESKPVIKVVEIDVPNDKRKSPTITEQSSLFPSDLSQANRILADLGLNMDLNSFASNIMKNPKDLSTILQSDQVKQIAAASGFNLQNAAAFLPPEAQPLVNYSQSLFTNNEADIFTTKLPGPIFEPEVQGSLVHSGQQGINKTTPQPVMQTSVHPQQHNQQVPHGVHRQPHPRPQHPHQRGQHPHHPHDPVVNIMNIPMNPGMPGLQMPPAFTNFVHLPPNAQIPVPKLNKRPLFNIPSFHLPIPSFSSLNPFANSFSHSKDRSDGSTVQSSQGPQARSDSFPQGPRSLRLRRSVTKRSRDNQINVNKGFQVVTAIDLAFFPNATTDLPQIFDGRREEVVYGVCLPIMGFAAAITCILLVVICSLVFSLVMLHKISRRSKTQNFQVNPVVNH